MCFYELLLRLLRKRRDEKPLGFRPLNENGSAHAALSLSRSTSFDPSGTDVACRPPKKLPVHLLRADSADLESPRPPSISSFSPSPRPRNLDSVWKVRAKALQLFDLGVVDSTASLDVDHLELCLGLVDAASLASEGARLELARKLLVSILQRAFGPPSEGGPHIALPAFPWAAPDGPPASLEAFVRERAEALRIDQAPASGPPPAELEPVRYALACWVYETARCLFRCYALPPPSPVARLLDYDPAPARLVGPARSAPAPPSPAGAGGRPWAEAFGEGAGAERGARAVYAEWKASHRNFLRTFRALAFC
eukprot:tig00001336_g8233.t1